MAVDISSEPTTGMVVVGRAGAVGTENMLLFHAGLTVYDGQSALMPRLAERVPSTQNGDWRVRPDGRMEVTWHLRQDGFWHDGTPLTAEDFVFGTVIRTDRSMGVTSGPPARLVESVAAPAPYTFVVSWKQPYINGNVSGADDFTALPKHLMESTYQQSDSDAFLASPFWTTGWVGLGPYRISNWVLGSRLEAAAFDQYLIGRPKIDRLIIQYFGDPNSAMAALISGAVDMTPVGSTYVVDQMVTVKNAWDPTQAGTTLAIPRGVRTLKLQFRDPSAPWSRDVSIRKALAFATDRQAIVDTLEYGLTNVPDTWLPANDPTYPMLEARGLVRYPYDPAQAARLLNDAGWAKGADGVYQRGGQRFAIDVSALGRASFPQEAAALAGQWSLLGLASAPAIIPGAATNREELTSTFQGVITWPMPFAPQQVQDLTSAQIGSSDTRWRGSNFGGYRSSDLDEIYDRLQTALETRQQRQLLVDALKIENDDVPAIPEYTYVASVMFRKGVTGPGTVSPNQLASAWNIHTWDIQ